MGRGRAGHAGVPRPDWGVIGDRNGPVRDPALVTLRVTIPCGTTATSTALSRKCSIGRSARGTFRRRRPTQTPAFRPLWATRRTRLWPRWWRRRSVSVGRLRAQLGEWPGWAYSRSCPGPADPRSVVQASRRLRLHLQGLGFEFIGLLRSRRPWCRVTGEAAAVPEHGKGSSLRPTGSAWAVERR